MVVTVNKPNNQKWKPRRRRRKLRRDEYDSMIEICGLIGIIVCIAVIIGLTVHCISRTSPNIKYDNQFIECETGNPDYHYVIDDISGIVYLKNSDGGMCVMVDHQGNPIDAHMLETEE